MYFIGNCGRPSFVRECPICKAQIGGLNHEYASKNNKKIELDDFLADYERKLETKTLEYQPRDFDNWNEELTMRYFKNGVAFRVAEQGYHSRLFWEFFYQEDPVKKQKLVEFLKLSHMNPTENEALEYLLKVCERGFESVAKFTKSEMTAYVMQLIIFQHMKNFELPSSNDPNKPKRYVSRSDIEKQMHSDIWGQLRNYNSIVNRWTKEVKMVDTQVVGNRQLVSEWITKLASKKDITSSGLSSSKVVSGLRLHQETNQEILAERLLVLHPEETQYPFLKYCLRHLPVLEVFAQMFADHIELTNALANLVDFRITWAQACRITVAQVLGMEKEGNTTITDERDEELLAKLVEKARESNLKGCFEKVTAWWQQIPRLRDNFPDVFDFRFMCHGNALPEEKLAELMDPYRAKLAYYLVDDKHVESLFIPSALQTLSKYQNHIITEYGTYFTRVNGKSKYSLPVQQAQAVQLVGLTANLQQLAQQYTLIGTSFNRETEISFDFFRIEALLAEDIFFGRVKLGFQEEHVDNIGYMFSMSTVSGIWIISRFSKTKDIMGSGYAKNIQRRLNAPAEPLRPDQIESLEAAIAQSPQAAFNTIAHSFKQLAGPLATSKTSKLDPRLPVPGISETDALFSINLVIGQLIQVYEELEEKVYGLALAEIDPIFNKPLPTTTNVLAGNFPPQLIRGVKKLVMRTLSGCHNEKVGEATLRMAIEYSGISLLDEIDEQVICQTY